MTSAKPTKTLKILISRNNAGGQIGGAELSAIDQAAVLKKLNQQPVVVSGLFELRSSLDAGVPSQIWIRAERWSSWMRQIWLLLFTPITFLEALYYAWRLQPDVINPHSREDQIAFTMTKWLHRRPVIWKDPGDLRHRILAKRTNPLALLNQKLLVAAIRRADHIYTLNKADVNYLLKQVDGLDKTRLSAVPSSILYERYQRSTTKLKPTGQLVVGVVSQLVPHKGIQDLIAAFKKQWGDNLELWIIGDGSARKILEKMAEADDRIKFFGEQRTVSAFLSAIDIFVQPAYHEGWGRNVKEAMYFGKAIIGADSGGTAAQIKDGQTGLLYQTGNVRQLIKYLERLIKDETLRKKLGSAAKAEAEKQGDFQRIVERQILPLYRKYAERP